MDSAQGRARRQTPSSTSNRRDLDLDRSSAKDGRSTAARVGGNGGATTPKTGQTYLSPTSPRPNASGATLGLGDVLSKLQQGGADPPPRAKKSNDVNNKPKRPKDESGDKPKNAKVDAKHRVKSKSTSPDERAGTSKDKQSSDTLRQGKDSKQAPGTRSAPHTPKNKKRSKSSSRPRDAPRPSQTEEVKQPAPDAPISGIQDKRASIPVIRLSREDSKRQQKEDHQQTEDTAPEEPLSPPKDRQRRLSQLSQQARLAFEKVAMAVTETETVIEREKTPEPYSSKPRKDKRARSQSAPREIPSSRAGKSAEHGKKGHSRRVSRDIESERDSEYEKDPNSKHISMQQLVPKQQHRKTDAHRKQSRVEGEISVEGVSSSTSQPKTSVSAAPKSSAPFKFFQSITRPSSLNTSSKVPSPPRQPTPSRPRKKFSRGHIDQDPLEVDYEILDDRVASIEPRRSIPSVEPRRSLAHVETYRTSAEEPLLPKHGESDHKLKSRVRDSETVRPAARPSSMPYIQTFPRTKQQQQADLYSPTTPLYSTEKGKSRKAATPSSEQARPFSSNQLGTPDSVFSSMYKVHSQSSFTSSDARSEVCLDLPDVTDQPEHHYRDTERDPRDIQVKLGFPTAPYRRIKHYTQSSLCFAILSAIVVFFLSFILLWPVLVLIIVVVPLVVLFKRVCSWCCCCGVSLWGRCCLCLCHTHLTSSELLWLGRGIGGPNPIAQSLMVLQKGLDTDRIRNIIDSRLLSVENRRGRKIYPRFTQKVMAFCCGRAWVTDKQFSVSKHVYNMPGYIETLEDLQLFISKMAAEPLSLDHPLWEVQVLHNFREPRDTVLLFRMHLCMTDGVSMVHVLENALVDTQKTTYPKATFSAEAANTSPFKVIFSGPYTFLSRYLFARHDFNLLHGRHVHRSGEMVVAWSEPFSLSAAMRVKQVARCTLSELLLSIVSGNVRTYLQVSGITHPFNVRCAVPIDFQAMDGAVDMENKYSLVVLQLPTNTEGAIPRLWETKHRMGKFKSSAEAGIVNGARWITYCLLPVSFFQGLWRKIYSKCTLMVANLAGPTSVLKIDSREVKCMMYWVPPMDRVPLTISFITYADQIRMAVIADRSVVPNPDLLTRDFIYKLETLSKLLAHRRIPGESASSNRHENVHLLSSFTLDDLTAEQIQLEMSLVQQEIHDLKVQLEAGPSNHISHNDTQLMSRIESLKERSRELMMHLRKRKAEESETAVILSEEDDVESEIGLDRPQRPFRRRTLSLSSKMSTASVSSTVRPLSTASTSNLPSPVHAALPSWPEGDIGLEELDENFMGRRGHAHAHRTTRSVGRDFESPVANYGELKGRYHTVMS